MFHVKQKHQRLALISCGLLSLGAAVFFILTAFQDSLIFFYTPSDLFHKKISRDHLIRIGGLVAKRSVIHEGKSVRFRITDHKETLKVSYDGLLPDLFQEGKGVVVEGYLLSSGELKAKTILAKHDEKYMPKEVADHLKQTGHWQDDK